MIVRTRGDANKSASASPVVARARPGQALPSKSPLVSPRTGEGQQPLSSPRTGGEGARSPPVSPRPAGAAYLMLLDSRSDFIGPFVIEYEVLDKRTGKLAWMTTEDMDARHGPGAADWLIAQFEQNPPPQRQRPEVTVPEEPRSPAAAPAPVPLPAPAPAAASAPALRKKGTLLDKLDDAINRKLGGPTSPRRQVPPLDLSHGSSAVEEGKSPGRKSPRGEELVDLPRSATASPRPAPSPEQARQTDKKKSDAPPPVLEKKTSAVGTSPRKDTAAPAPAAGAPEALVSPKLSGIAARPRKESNASGASATSSGSPERPPAVSPKSGQSVMERMRLLKELHQSGLIETEEYEAKRKQILDSL